MNLWDIIALQPLINILIVLTRYLFNNFGLAIVALTIIINLALLPLTLSQTRSSIKAQEMQAKFAELQRKYAKDKQRLQQEQIKLYKESGVGAAGCIVPLLIQTPFWLALYQTIVRLLAVTPEDLLGISRYLYSWPMVYTLLPLPAQFLWANLAASDLILSLLVGATMWIQQKMMPATVADPRQRSQTEMMQWMMPIMFTYITFLLPSGLALYWVVSSVFRIVVQYFALGDQVVLPGFLKRWLGREGKAVQGR